MIPVLRQEKRKLEDSKHNKSLETSVDNIGQAYILN
jgi:hypothetical protein